jgi:hypothetical protein
MSWRQELGINLHLNKINSNSKLRQDWMFYNHPLGVLGSWENRGLDDKIASVDLVSKAIALVP